MAAALQNPPPSYEVSPAIANMMEALALRQVNPTYASDTSSVAALRGLQDIPVVNILVHKQINAQDGWFGFLNDVSALQRTVGTRRLVIGPADTVASTNDEFTRSKQISIRRFVYKTSALHAAVHCVLATTAFDMEESAAEAKAMLHYCSLGVMQRVQIHSVLTLLNAPFMTAGTRGNLEHMYPLQYLYGMHPTPSELILNSARYVLSVNIGRNALTNGIAMIVANRDQCGRAPLECIYMSKSVAVQLNAPGLQTRAFWAGDEAAASMDRGEPLMRLAGLPIVPISIAGPERLNICPFESATPFAQHFVINEHPHAWASHPSMDRGFESLRISTFNGRSRSAHYEEIPLMAIAGSPIWVKRGEKGWALDPDFKPYDGKVENMFVSSASAIAENANASNALWAKYIVPVLKKMNIPAGDDGVDWKRETYDGDDYKNTIFRLFQRLCEGGVLDCRFLVIQYVVMNTSSIVLAQPKCIDMQVGPIHTIQQPNAELHYVKYGFDALLHCAPKDPSNILIMPDVYGSRLLRGAIGNLNDSIELLYSDGAAPKSTTLTLASLPRFGLPGASALAFCLPNGDQGEPAVVPNVVSITGDTPSVFSQVCSIQDVSDDMAMCQAEGVAEYYYKRCWENDYERKNFIINPCMTSVRSPDPNAPDVDIGLPWGSLQGFQRTFRPGNMRDGTGVISTVETAGVSPLAPFCRSNEVFGRLMGDMASMHVAN